MKPKIKERKAGGIVRILCAVGVWVGAWPGSADMSPKPAAAELVENTSPPAGAMAPAATQPVGTLSGRIVFTSAGHGWTYNNSNRADDEWSEKPAGWYTRRPVLNDMNEDYGNLDQMTMFVLYCFNAGATVVALRPVGHQTNEVVLDNDDLGVTFSGRWLDSTATTFYGDKGDVPYRYASISPFESATATYTPKIPVAGSYPVYTWVSHGPDRTSQLYRIRHTGGESQVRVPHHMVGNGWVYLGTYYFSAGANSANGCVQVSNLQPSPSFGSVVIADAIRFGNGMGDVRPAPKGSETPTFSGYPREEECSRYWVQRSLGQGASSNIYDLTGYGDGDDDVGTPPRMATNMNRQAAENMYKRIYLGFHSNASGDRGSLGLWNDSSLEPPAVFDGTATPNQLRWAQIVGKEVNDAMVGIGSPPMELAWHDRGDSVTYRRTDYAYGEINNKYINSEFDASIIEAAFHDNADDAKLLRDPKARNWVARACYQAVVKYMNEFDGVPLTFLPEPPRNARAVATSGGITVSWSTPVGQGNSGAPTSYVVYRSTDGCGFGNPVAVNGGSSTSATVTGLTPNADYYFRIVAVNAGGESLPSETVGCRPALNSSSARVLVVNGYSRLDRLTNLRQTLIPSAYRPPGNVGTIERVRPRANNSFDYVVQYGKALSAYGMAFDSCARDAVLAGQIQLSIYPIVVWACGQETNEVFNSAAQTLLTSFLSVGGNLFLSGSDIASSLGRSSGPSAGDRAFLNNQLHVDLGGDANNDSKSYSVEAALGSIFVGREQASFDDGTKGIYWVRAPDVLLPVGRGATRALNYINGIGGAAAIQYDGSAGGGKVVFWGFPFETVANANLRTDYLSDILDYFTKCAIIRRAVALDTGLPVAGAQVTLAGQPLGFTDRLGRFVVPCELCGTWVLEIVNGALRFLGPYSVDCPQAQSPSATAPERAPKTVNSGNTTQDVLLTNTLDCGSLPISTRFQAGDVVEVFGTGTGLRARLPNPCDDSIQTMPDGSIGTIVGGPECCNGYNRWFIHYNDLPGTNVWSAEGEPNTGEFFLRKVISCTDLNEPNDSSLNATTVALGVATSGYVCTSSDVDWFKVHVTEPGPLTFNLTVPAEDDYDIELYGPDTYYIKGSYGDVGSPETIVHNALVSGTYYVRVYGYPVGNGSYNLDTPYTLTATFSPGAISFLTPPQDRTVPAGASAVFSVVAGGAPPLSYQWQRSADGVAPFVDVPGATLPTYATPPLALADSGAQYRVRISNAFDTITSAPATLTVTSPNVITWVGGHTDGWDNPLNWSPESVPTATDSVVVSSGNVTVPTGAIVGVLRLEGGSVSGTFTVAGTLTWADGSLDRADLTIGLGGVLNIVGATDKPVGGYVQLKNAGTINWLGSGGVYVTGPGFGGVLYLTNLTDGVMNLLSDADFGRGYGWVEVHNAGLVRKAGGVGTFTFNTSVFENTGTVEVQSGTVQFNNGFTSSGAVTVAAGARLQFAGGNYAFNAGSTLDAAPGGTLDYQGGSFAFDSGATVTARTTNRVSGSIAFSGTVDLPNFELATGGNLSGTFTNAGTLTWSDGSLRSADLTIGSGGVLNIVGATDKPAEGYVQLKNAGTINWLSSGGVYVTGPGFGGVLYLTNLTDGVMNLLSDADFGRGYGWVEVHNAGLVRKAGGVGTFTFNTSVFENTGTVEVQSGTVQFNNGFTSSGAVTVAAGARLQFAGGNYAFNAGSTLDAAPGGTLDYQGGSFAFDSGATVTARTTNRVSGSIAFSGTVNLPNFELATGGNLSGTFTNAGTLTWSDGSLRSADLTIGSGGVLNIVGATDKPAEGYVQLKNAGTINWLSSGGVYVTGPGFGGVLYLTNLTDGVMNLLSDADFGRGYGWVEVHNAGLVRKAGGVGAFTFNTSVFENTGTVEVQSGTLSFPQGFSSGGTIVVAAGAGLQFAGGNYVFKAGSTLDALPGGTLAYQGGNFTFDPGATVTARTTNRVTGNVAFSGTVNLPNFELAANGQLSGTFTNAGTLTWTDGGLDRADLTIGLGGVLNIVGATDKPVGGNVQLKNAGTINWLGSGAVYVTYPSGGGGPFGPGSLYVTNLIEGAMNLMSDSEFRRGNGRLEFHNAGVLRKLGGAGTFTFNTSAFENAGTVEPQSGTVQFNNGFTSSGAITVAEGARLQYAGGNYVFNAGSGLDVAPGGTLDYQSGNFTFDSGATVTARTTNRVTGNVAFSGTVNLPNFELATNGSLSGTFTNAGTLTWTDGTIANADVTIGSGGVLNIEGPTDKPLVGLVWLNNAGTINWLGGGSIYVTGGGFGGAVFFSNRTDGVLNLLRDADIGHGFGRVEVHNAGLVRKTGGAGTFTFHTSVFENTGTIDVQSGTVQFDGQFIESPAANLLVAIGGSTPGAGYGQFAFSGQVTLAGTLKVDHRDSFRPNPGDRFAVISFQSASGDFASMNGLDYGNGLFLKPEFTRTGLTLEAVQVSLGATPRLTVLPTWNSALIIWPIEFSNYQLEFTTNLTAPEWLPVTVVGTNNFILDNRTPMQFFRLKAE